MKRREVLTKSKLGLNANQAKIPTTVVTSNPPTAAVYFLREA
jgi:hypothetical protein